MTNKEIYKALRKALDEMHKEEEAETLAYFKRELLKHLNTLKDEAHTERIEKAIFMLTLIAKSGYPVGTVRTWRGTKFKKIAQGKWRRIYDKEDRGAKMSIARLKKQVEKCESTKELLDLVLQNKSRFMDENGKPLSIVKELSAYAKEKGREKIKERAQKTQGLRNHFARQNKKEQESKNGIVEKNELTEKQIKNAVEPTQAEFENIIDNIFLGNYKAVPSAIKLPSLQKELIEKLGVSGNFYLTQKRMKHINPQRKASHNNQDFRKEEYKDILNMIKNAKRAYIDTAKGNFLIAKKDKMNENKANIICFNKDKLGNYIVTIKKVDKVELKKQELEKVEVGVSPTITRQNGAPASNGHTGISTDNSISQKADSVNVGKTNLEKAKDLLQTADTSQITTLKQFKKYADRMKYFLSSMSVKKGDEAALFCITMNAKDREKFDKDFHSIFEEKFDEDGFESNGFETAFFFNPKVNMEAKE